MGWAAFISLITSVLISGTMILFGRNITMLFIHSDIKALEQAAGNTAYRYLCVMSLALPILYLLHIYRAALQGVSNTRIPLLSGVVEFVIRLGGSVLVSMSVWQEGIFLAEVGAWVGAAVLLAVAYFHMESRLQDRRRSHG